MLAAIRAKEPPVKKLEQKQLQEATQIQGFSGENPQYKSAGSNARQGGRAEGSDRKASSGTLGIKTSGPS